MAVEHEGSHVEKNQESRGFWKSIPLPLKVFLLFADVVIIIGVLYYFS